VGSVSDGRDLNVMIMNYLVHQGYPSAAVAFAREANLALSRESVDSISARMKIRNQIHAGEIEKAIYDINTLNPQVSPAPFPPLPFIQYFTNF
jgi:hypothetical protein